MSETQPDLREALARWLADELFDENVGPEHYRYADAIFADPLAPIVSENTVLRAANAELGTGDWTDVRQLEAEARISALQAEVEKAWLTECAALTFKNERDKAETERDAALADCSRLQNDYADAMAGIRSEMERADRLSAEVERLQKVEGEREKGRVPDGTGLSPDGQTASRSDPSDFDPSRGPLADFARQMIRHAWNGEDVDGGTIQDTAASLGLLREEPYDPKKHGGTTLCEIGDTWFVFAGPLASASDEHPAGEDAKRLSGEAMPARSASADAPSDNPLAETKEGSELNIFPAS